MSEQRLIQSRRSQLLHVKEIAEMLRLKPRTIYEMVGRQSIPFYKPAGTPLFDLDEILDWVKKGRRE